jgi:uncharacterized protein
MTAFFYIHTLATLSKRSKKVFDEQLLAQIKRDTDMWQSPWHGLKHWSRVMVNGLSLAAETGADVDIIPYFALLHDCCRHNEYEDPLHGPRAASYAKKHRNLIQLDDYQFYLLIRACAGHTHALPGCKASFNDTIATCWDADRLDIGRVGLIVDERYLFTRAAKNRVSTLFSSHTCTQIGLASNGPPA